MKGAGPGLVKLTSALNAGWLSAASCIGIELVREAAEGGIDKASVVPAVGIAAAATGGALAALGHFKGGWIGLGYASAVAWALQAIKVGPASPSLVQQSAQIGVGVLAGGMALAAIGSTFFARNGPSGGAGDAQSLLDRK